jgi:hypothetical protein
MKHFQEKWSVYSNPVTWSDDDIDGKQDGEVEENDVQVGRQNEDIVQGEDGG